MALLFSSFSSPALSALLTFLVFIDRTLQRDLKSLAGSMGSAGRALVIYRSVLSVAESANYSFITPAAHGRTPSGFVLLALSYACVYIVVILAAATLVFSRRNFK